MHLTTCELVNSFGINIIRKSDTISGGVLLSHCHVNDNLSFKKYVFILVCLNFMKEQLAN